MKKKARTAVAGGGDKSLLSDPASELRLGREKEKEKTPTWDEQKKANKCQPP